MISLESRRRDAKKMMRMQTDEVVRLREFRNLKVTRQTTTYLAHSGDAAHTGAMHTSNRRNPYHANQAIPEADVESKQLTTIEATELVARLTTRK